MQAYKQLLVQFHNQQASIIEDDCQVKYLSLLNMVKSNKKKKLINKNQINFQCSRLKTFNNEIMHHSSLQTSFTNTNTSFFNDPLRQQKTKLVQLQHESLLNQIDNLNLGLRNLKEDKRLIQNQIKLIDDKEIQITNALFQSQKNLQELNILIKQKKQQNKQAFLTYDKKIQQLTQKLKQLHQQNVLNAKYYKERRESETENNNSSLVGTILMWQKEESKIKKIPKKIYTKSQIQSMLRALFIINRLSQLNYGNIIQHLILNQDKNKKINEKDNILFKKRNGQQIQIKKLVSKLQTQIITVEQSKFLSKMKIIQFYQKKGIIISKHESEQGNKSTQLSQQTNKLIKKILQQYQKLTSWFSRIQKRNIQLSQYFRSLQAVNQTLSSQIKSIEQSADQKNINYLQLRENQIQNLHFKLNGICRIVFQFNINVYDLVRRFQNLNKCFDRIVKSTNRKTYKRTYVQLQDDFNFLKKFTRILFKNPQCIILDWNKVIKTSKQFLPDSSDSFFQLHQISQNQYYLDKIVNNDLLRIYAEPSMFNPRNSYIQNFQTTFNYVLSEQKQIICKLSYILKGLLLFSKNGIQTFRQLIIQERQQRRKSHILKNQQAKNSLNPLLRILQANNTQLDKYFKKDQIKEQEKKQQQKPQEGKTIQQKMTEQFRYCVESNEYYRRDNFKIIEKLQKLDLKKRGFFVSSPFSIDTSLQLQPLHTTLNTSIQKEYSGMGSTRNTYRRRQPRLSHQLLSNRHNQISQRRQKQSLRKKDLKNLLNNISNIASQNQKYRIRKKLFTKEKQSEGNSLSKIIL